MLIRINWDKYNAWFYPKHSRMLQVYLTRLSCGGGFCRWAKVIRVVPLQLTVPLTCLGLYTGAPGWGGRVWKKCGCVRCREWVGWKYSGCEIAQSHFLKSLVPLLYILQFKHGYNHNQYNGILTTLLLLNFREQRHTFTWTWRSHTGGNWEEAILNKGSNLKYIFCCYICLYFTPCILHVCYISYRISCTVIGIKILPVNCIKYGKLWRCLTRDFHFRNPVNLVPVQMTYFSEIGNKSDIQDYWKKKKL